MKHLLDSCSAYCTTCRASFKVMKDKWYYFSKLYTLYILYNFSFSYFLAPACSAWNETGHHVTGVRTISQNLHTQTRASQHSLCWHCRFHCALLTMFGAGTCQTTQWTFRTFRPTCQCKQILIFPFRPCINDMTLETEGG